MRLLLSVCVLTGLAAAQATTEESNIACVRELIIPGYPKRADQARVAGIVIVKMKVSPEGKPLDIKVDGPRLLDVTTAMKKTTFSAGCAGKLVTVVFEFVLGEELEEQITFLPPNRYRVAAAAKLIKY
jgi:outer membrane biosynthesis protein TonB